MTVISHVTKSNLMDQQASAWELAKKGRSLHVLEPLGKTDLSVWNSFLNSKGQRIFFLDTSWIPMTFYVKFRVGMYFSTSFLQLRSWNTQRPPGPYPGNTWRQGIWNTVPVRKAGGVARHIHKYLIAHKQGTHRCCTGAHCTKLDSHQHIPLLCRWTARSTRLAASRRPISHLLKGQYPKWKKKKENPKGTYNCNSSESSLLEQVYTQTHSLSLTENKENIKTTQASHWETQLKNFQESNCMIDSHPRRVVLHPTFLESWKRPTTALSAGKQ